MMQWKLFPQDVTTCQNDNRSKPKLNTPQSKKKTKFKNIKSQISPQS